MNNPFTYATVAAIPGYGSLVEWGISREFVPASSTLTFNVEWTQDLSLPWTQLNTSSIVNEMYWHDTAFRLQGQYVEGFYRVVLVDASTYYSDPFSLYGAWTANEWRMAREILRKEYLKYRKMSGAAEGWLLKRRHWGTVCTTCTDPDTHLTVDTQCSTCYGTGFVGGYFTAFPFYMEMTGKAKQEQKTDSAVGVTDTLMDSARCIAYPMVTTDDIWINDTSGVRYFVKGFRKIAVIRDIPLIVEVVLARLPIERIEYQVQVYPTPTPSPSPEE